MKPENGASIEPEQLPAPKSHRNSEKMNESRSNKGIDQCSDDYGEFSQGKSMKKFNIKNFFRKNLNLFDQVNSEKNP